MKCCSLGIGIDRRVFSEVQPIKAKKTAVLKFELCVIAGYIQVCGTVVGPTVQTGVSMGEGTRQSARESDSALAVGIQTGTSMFQARRVESENQGRVGSDNK